MRIEYQLTPTVAGEPGPVTLVLDVESEGPTSIAFLMLIEGARCLKPRPGIDPPDGRIVMRAGAEFSRYLGVRLSNGFNVVDPTAWRNQGIGTVAMNRMIRWAKQHHRDADVRPVELKRYGAEIRHDDPRLAFYRRFNLRWDPAEQRAAAAEWSSCPMTVAELNEAPLPAQIRLVR